MVTTLIKSMVSNASKISRKSRFILKILFLIHLAVGMSVVAGAQQTFVKSDSSKVYGKIEKFSKKNKITMFLYGLVFKPVAAILAKKRPEIFLQRPYSNFEGKIIRNINIVALDPFGFSESDTATVRQNIFLKTGNMLHVKSQYFTINNFVLVRINQPFDSLLVKESERLIRSQDYVYEVLFDVVSVEKTNDSVDITIRVLDRWSLIPNAAISSKRATIGFTENNFMGFGHEFQNAYTWNRSNRAKAFGTTYSIPNIRKTYISAMLQYKIDEHTNFGKGITVERPFFSPLAQWAAGLNISQQFQADTVTDTLPGYVRQNVKFNTQDYWAGKATRIFGRNRGKGNITNAIIAVRYLRIRYHEKPDERHDSLHRYSNEDFYISGIGISTLKYFQDYYIFDFGVIEDIPVGKVFGITGGYQIRNHIERLYLGTRFSFGDYYGWGYVSSTYEYGTFFHGSSIQQGVLALEANYISNLFKIGNWRIRQYAKPQVTLGMNRAPYDSLTINKDNGIQGFNSSLHGTKKIVLTLQTQTYTPWNVLGFRFGPYLICSLGLLGNATSGFKNSRVYQQFGIGTLIKNKYLVLSNFQISVAYYPSIPGKGYDIIKLNSFMTTDFGFGDLTFRKPGIVAFK